MHRAPSRSAAVLLATALLAVSCSATPSDSPSGLDSESLSPADTTEPTDAVDQPSESDASNPPTTTARQREAAGLAALEAALADAEPAAAFRVTTYVGQTQSFPEIGLDASSVIDLDRPASLSEIAADGAAKVSIDLGAITPQPSDATPEAIAAIDDVQLVLWTTGDQLTIDTRTYQGLVDLTPGLDLGWFAPGLSSVDLDLVGDVGEDEILRLLVGDPIPDLGTVAALLPGRMISAIPDPDDTRRFEGTATLADLIEVTGGTAEESATGAAAGVAPFLGIDGQRLADIYLDTYRSTLADVAVTVGENGGLASLQYQADLSPIYYELAEVFFDDELSPERLLFEQWALDAVSTIDTLLVFEADPTIVAEAPTEGVEDRTLLAIEFFEESGIDL